MSRRTVDGSTSRVDSENAAVGTKVLLGDSWAPAAAACILLDEDPGWNVGSVLNLSLPGSGRSAAF